MIDERVLLGGWAHSHEEDQGDLQVYRPLGYPLPPARGRSTFTLLAGGAAAAGSPGPDDRGQTVDGHWSLHGSTLTVSTGGRSTAYDVLGADGQRLQLRPRTSPTATPANTGSSS